LVRRGAYYRQKEFVKVELWEIEMGGLKLSSSEMDIGKEVEVSDVSWWWPVVCGK
jgi:hypothetical protein